MLMGNLDIDWSKLLTDNTPLIYNLASIELGLLVGMWLRGRFIDKAKFRGGDVLDFVFFTIVLCYLTVVSTFSNWPVPVLGYAAAGVLLPPFTVPLYNTLVTAAPSLFKTVLPEGFLKWVLEHTKAPAIETGETNDVK